MAFNQRTDPKLGLMAQILNLGQSAEAGQSINQVQQPQQPQQELTFEESQAQFRQLASQYGARNAERIMLGQSPISDTGAADGVTDKQIQAQARQSARDSGQSRMQSELQRMRDEILSNVRNRTNNRGF